MPTVIPLTATPIGVGHMADELVVAGVTSELFKCGALVPAVTICADEPALEAFKSTTKGIIELRGEVREVMLKVIIGRVLEYYHRLNPDPLPEHPVRAGSGRIPVVYRGVQCAGIPWSHIDSKQIILNGEQMPATRENRERLREAPAGSRKASATGS